MNFKRLLLLSLAFLGACGGGGGGGAPAPASKAWGTAALIETNDTGSAVSPQIAFDADGNALAVWVQGIDSTPGTRTDIWSNRYTAGSGWGTPTLIETDDAGSASNPQIVFDANGNALAIWAQDGDATAAVRTDIWANRYTAGSGWGTAVLLETNNAGNASDPRIAIDASGNALAVWSQFVGGVRSIVANRYTAGSGWGAAEFIETDNAGDASRPQIAFDAAGNALAIWEQDGDATAAVRTDIWANRYTAGSGWGTAELLETNDAGNASRPRIALDANGNALAVWSQLIGGVRSIVANRYTAGSGWGAADFIETDNAGDAFDPQIAVDANGNAIAVWQQFSGSIGSIVVNRYTPGSGWGAAEPIETDADDAFDPQIAFDADGNALAVWVQFDDGLTDNIWANRYTAGSGWGTAVLIETNAGRAFSPRIAIDASGNALAVWHQDTETGERADIWANRYQ